MDKIYLTTPLEEKSKSDGSTVSKIDFVIPRPLKAGDLINALDAAGDRAGSVFAHLMASSTRLTVKQVRELSLEDWASISEAVEVFLPASLKTGKPALKSSSEPLDTLPTLTGGPAENFAGGPAAP